MSDERPLPGCQGFGCGYVAGGLSAIIALCAWLMWIGALSFGRAGEPAPPT